MTRRYPDALPLDPERPKASYELVPEPIVGEVGDSFDPEPEEAPPDSENVLAWRAAIPSGTPTQDEVAGR